MSLPEWNAMLCRELGVDLDVNLKQVLNLAATQRITSSGRHPR
jgi:hypothetical protein